MWKGKVRPYQLMVRHQTFIEAFGQLGESVVLPADILMSLEEFVCAMYGSSNIDEVNIAKFHIIKPYKSQLMVKNQRFIEAFGQLGESVVLPADICRLRNLSVRCMALLISTKSTSQDSTSSASYSLQMTHINHWTKSNLLTQDTTGSDIFRHRCTEIKLNLLTVSTILNLTRVDDYLTELVTYSIRDISQSPSLDNKLDVYMYHR